MKKKKRGRSQKLSTLLWVMIAILLASVVLAMPFLMNTNPADSYATQAWIDPHRICTTEWVYPETDYDNPELAEALVDLPLLSTSITTERTIISCNSELGGSYQYHTDIVITLDSSEAIVSDEAQMGYLIYEILTAIRVTELGQAWGGIDVIIVLFKVDGARRASWHINYEEALRAHSAELTGSALYEIGRWR